MNDWVLRQRPPLRRHAPKLPLVQRRRRIEYAIERAEFGRVRPLQRRLLQERPPVFDHAGLLAERVRAQGALHRGRPAGGVVVGARVGVVVLVGEEGAQGRETAADDADAGFDGGPD